MTYIAELDPQTIDDSALFDWWDENFPGWEILSQEPEDRREVPADEVDNAGIGYVRRYGSDDPGRYYPGVDGE